MGKYEQFILNKDQKIIIDGMQALNEHVIITEDSGMFQVLMDEEKSVVLFKPEGLYAKIVDQWITASNVKWKENFRSMLRKNKIKYKSESLD